jgi:uncharacterized membrane protein
LKNKLTLRALVYQALLAAIYAALTIMLQPISYGPVQFRVSEALTVLPFVSPICTVGLTVGCLIANLVSSYGVWDVVFGSLATLLAGLLTAKAGKIWLAPMPPVVVNGLVVGAMLAWATAPGAFWVNFTVIGGQVALGELAVCYGLGFPLLAYLRKTNLFPRLDAGRPKN